MMRSSTDEDTALSGDLFADNGNGVDSDANGDAITVATVNGQSASVGQQITLASGALLTVNADGTFDYDPNGQFDSLAGGASTTDTFTYEVTDGSTAQTAGTFPATFELSSLLAISGGDGSNGFILNGTDISDRSGFSVASAGDVNGDGVDDLIIGARTADPNGQGDAGESYVVFGSAGGFSASLNLSALDGSNGFVLNGIESFDPERQLSRQCRGCQWRRR